MRAYVDYDEADDQSRFARVKVPPWMRAALASLSRCRHRVVTALPPTMLVEDDLLLRDRSKHAWGSCVTWFSVVALLAIATFLVAAIVVVSRTWSGQCDVPLRAYIIVALLLCVPLLTILLLINFTFTLALKGLLLCVVCCLCSLTARRTRFLLEDSCCACDVWRHGELGICWYRMAHGSG